MSQPLIATAKVFENPSADIHDAEIVEVKDLGEVDLGFGKKRRIRIKYQTKQKGSDGAPLSVIESLNLTITPTSRLFKRVTSLTGKQPGASFDVMTLVGWKGKIVVSHTTENGRTFANVDSVIRKGEPK